MRSRYLDILIWLTVLALVAGFGVKMLGTRQIQDPARIYRD
ncbi:hypothetical protein FG93_03329 [Bosea sp. LC85]|nr:hypothetical protein [Bosea sp. LC85]KFC69283.1 hypothetical protein FG93_03329 [Bosea sp. LC85]